MSLTEQERDRLFALLEDIRRLLGSNLTVAEQIRDRCPPPPPSSSKRGAKS